MADGEGSKQRRSQVATAAILRLLLASGLTLGVLTGLAAAGACLPDLTAIADADASDDDAGLTPLCGNGVIDNASDGGAEQCDPGAADAEVRGCTSCRIACEGTLDPKTNHCYFAAGAYSKYNDAVTRCLLAGGHVVTLNSDDEVVTVSKEAANESGYWVGLLQVPSLNAYRSDRLEEPGLPYTLRNGQPASGPCEGCFSVGADGGVLPIADVDASVLGCVAQGASASSDAGGWFQVDCNSAVARPTICEREPDGVRALAECPIGAYCFDVAATSASKRYFVFNTGVDPDVAAQSCALVPGGALALLESREEREQVAHEILEHSPEAVEQQLWIGLTTDAGAWTWDDGVAASSRPSLWGDRQPADAGRAYVRITATSYDTQLAYADGTRTPRLYICQRPRN